MSLCTLLPALAYAQSARLPDYVTAWPSQVQVDKPDPVTGDRSFWELVIHDEAFARRFKGFEVANANRELTPGMQALVFRVYKDVIYKDRPPLYRCEYETYFDADLRLPVGNPPKFEPTKTIDRAYPSNVSPLFRRLEALDAGEQKTLANARPAELAPTNFGIYADGKLDGRFQTYNVRYFPAALPRLSIAVFGGGFNCSAIAPKPAEAHYWLSILGRRPYQQGWLATAPAGITYDSTLTRSFEPGRDPAADGYYRIPEIFFRRALDKVTLAKALNICIMNEDLYSSGRALGTELREETFRACNEMRNSGVIYNVLGRCRTTPRESKSCIQPGWHELAF